MKKIFKRKPEYLVDVEQQHDSKTFVLMYGKDEIGYLKYREQKWAFEYSDWFKNQDRILPLIEFPSKNRIYNSDELWSFFSSRIPSTKQPKIKELKEKGYKPNIADLLELFGKHSVNNPFVLRAL